VKCTLQRGVETTVRNEVKGGNIHLSSLTYGKEHADGANISELRGTNFALSGTAHVTYFKRLGYYF
jgi:hypothetical protein